MQGRDPAGSGGQRCLIACDVFHNALLHLGVDRRDAPWSIIYLPAHLHLRPDRLEQKLLHWLETDPRTKSCAGCLYGRCSPNIDTVLKARAIERIDCGHCYEILLGQAVHDRVVSEQPGTFFLEKTVIEDFDNLCRAPLELDDPQMRSWYFEHYRQVVYIRQPRDPDLLEAVRRIARLLCLDYQVMDADYADLAAYLKKRDMFQR
jgi:hypothetical protein